MGLVGIIWLVCATFNLIVFGISIYNEGKMYVDDLKITLIFILLGPLGSLICLFLILDDINTKLDSKKILWKRKD